MAINRINLKIADADVTAMTEALATIHAKLPFPINLSNEDRHDLPKMGSKSGVPTPGPSQS
jgi:hypothetical protein